MSPQPSKSLLIVGPLPPPPTGPHVAFQYLCREVEECFGSDRVEIIDTSQKIIKKNVKRIASLGNMKQAWRIARQFRARVRKADHVLIFGSNGFILSMAPILMLMAKRRRLPVYLRPFGGSLDQYAQSLNPILRRILAWTLRHADGLSVQTELLRDGLTPIVGEDIQVAPNYRCLPSQDCVSGPREASTGTLRLMFLGIVGEAKGVFMLLESMRQLAATEADVHCDIFGPTAPASAERFEEQIRRTDNATYQGTLQPHEVIATLSRYDALVLPTHYQGEGHPGVIIEAMMAGIPVISTRHRSIPELVKDGVNGLLVDADDKDSLTAAITRLDSDRDLVSKLARGSWEARAGFDSCHVIPTILNQMGVDMPPASEPAQDSATVEPAFSAR